MISVVVCVYNVEKYLSACLDSIIQQTFKDIEIIVVNDCSPGNCIEIVEKYQKRDSRIRLINLEKNRGTLHARCVGALAAVGDYVQNVDGDDLLNPNALEKIYEAIQKFQADAYWISGTNIENSSREFFLKIAYPKFSKTFFEKKDLMSMFLSYNGLDAKEDTIPGLITLTIYATKYAQEIAQKLFDLPKLIQTEDFLHQVYLFDVIDRLVIIDEPLYLYRVGVGICANNSQKMLLRRIISLVHVYKLTRQFILEKYPELIEIFRIRMSREILSYFSNIECRIVKLFSKEDILDVAEIFYDLSVEKSKILSIIRQEQEIPGKFKSSMKKIVKGILLLIITIFNKLISMTRIPWSLSPYPIHNTREKGMRLIRQGMRCLFR